VRRGYPIAASDATSRITGYGNRPPVSYVPVNDTRRHKLLASTDLSKLKDAGLDLLPEHRGRQARQFPVAISRMKGCRPGGCGSPRPGA